MNDKSKFINKPPRYRNHRLEQIWKMMESKKIKGNPRDFVVVVGRNLLIDRSGVYEIEAQFPSKLEPGNHVYLNLIKKGIESVITLIVVEDKGEDLLIRDVKNTFTQLIRKTEVYPLPLPKSPILIHKKKLDFFLGPSWKKRFWNQKLKRRKNRILN